MTLRQHVLPIPDQELRKIQLYREIPPPRGYGPPAKIRIFTYNPDLRLVLLLRTDLCTFCIPF